MSSQSKKFFSFFIATLMLIQSSVSFADESQPSSDKVSTVVTKGSKAPFDGVLLSVKLAAEIKANCDPVNIENKVKIERDEATKLCQSECKSQIDVLNAKLQASQEKHQSVIAAKDKEIEALRDLLKPAPWYQSPKLWFGVGLIAGGATVVVLARNL